MTPFLWIDSTLQCMHLAWVTGAFRSLPRLPLELTKYFKIINVGQVLVIATAEYKTHGRFRPNAMDNKENKILSGDLEPNHVMWSFASYPGEKYYDDTLSKKSRRFKNPNRKPNFMQVGHCRRFSMIIACKSSLCCPSCFGQIPQ